MGQRRTSEPWESRSLSHGRVPGLASARASPGIIRTASAVSWSATSTVPLTRPLLCRKGTESWPTAHNTEEGRRKNRGRAPVDLTYGGWGQDGHIAYNQARRHPFSHLTLDDVRNATVSRTGEQYRHNHGACAAQFRGGPTSSFRPCRLTLGVKECLSAARVRLFSDTGSWKQTALRVALFGTAHAGSIRLTLLQEHPDAVLTATVDTARHPIGEHPEWDFGL